MSSTPNNWCHPSVHPIPGCFLLQWILSNPYYSSSFLSYSFSCSWEFLMIFPFFVTLSPFLNPSQVILTIFSKSHHFQRLLPHINFLKLCFIVSNTLPYHIHLSSSREVNRAKILENHALQKDIFPLLQVLPFQSGQEGLVDLQINYCVVCSVSNNILKMQKKPPHPKPTLTNHSFWTLSRTSY